MYIDDKIREILSLIQNHGYDAYLVGGYVRDCLLGKTSYDIDITTNALPLTLKEILKDYKLNDRFIEYGCIKLKVNNYNIEITTFRKEGKYLDHRKPSTVEFTSNLKEDLKRRDFTINALCYNQELIDIFDGAKDLKNKIIKTIKDSEDSFKEDSLRILRALRFSSALSFNLSDDIKKAIKNNYKYLKKYSFLTLHKELKGILNGDNYLFILKEYKKELMDIYSLCDLKTELFKKNMSYEEKEALFYYFSKNKIDNIYLYNKDIEFKDQNIYLKKLLYKYGYETINNILYFKTKYFNVFEKEYKMIKEIVKNKECYNLKMLEINGNDLLNINIKKEKIGKILNKLLELVIENKLINEKETLLEYAKKER